MSAAGAIRSSSRRPGWRNSNGLLMRWPKPRQKLRRRRSSLERATAGAQTGVKGESTFRRMFPLPWRLQAGRIAPKALKVIPLTNVIAHDVDNDIEEIQHQPAGLQCSVHGPGAQTVLLL